MGLSFHSVRQTILFPACHLPPTCMQQFGVRPVKYRTVDGSCNNLENTFWGMSRTIFQRILPPNYSDG